MQLEGESSEDLRMHELLGLDKQLKSIRGSLKVEVAEKVKLEERIKKEKHKLEEIRDNPEYDDRIRGDIRKRVARGSYLEIWQMLREFVCISSLLTES